MDQGRQAGGRDDAAFMPPLQGQRGTAVAEPLAYNLGNLWLRLALRKVIANWSLTSLQQRVVKTGGRLIRHARYYGCCSPKVT